MSGRFFRSVSDSEDSSSSSDEELMSDSEDEQQEKKTTTPAAAPKKQSRFLKTAGGSDDSSSESEDDDDDDDDDSDEDSDDSDKPKKAAAGGAAGQAPKVSRFMRGAASDDSDSDSDDDEVKKVIRSAKDKRTDEVDAVVKTIDNAQRIDDWVAISKEYDNLLRLFDRQKNMNEIVPVSFYRCLSGLEEFLNQTVAAGKSKKMKAPNAKAMNSMKSKLKKAIKDHDDEISKYRAVSSTPAHIFPSFLSFDSHALTLHRTLKPLRRDSSLLLLQHQLQPQLQLAQPQTKKQPTANQQKLLQKTTLSRPSAREAEHSQSPPRVSSNPSPPFWRHEAERAPTATSKSSFSRSSSRLPNPPTRSSVSCLHSSQLALTTTPHPTTTCQSSRGLLLASKLTSSFKLWQPTHLTK